MTGRHDTVTQNPRQQFIPLVFFFIEKKSDQVASRPSLKVQDPSAALKSRHLAGDLLLHALPMAERGLHDLALNPLILRLSRSKNSLSE
jgi:hypothetical protein